MVESHQQSDTQKAIESLLKEMLQEHPHAFEWVKDLFNASLLWDHIVDRDDIDVDAADDSFMAMWVRWPLNPFFDKFKHVLVPVVVNAISAWKWSNAPGTPKIKAFDIYNEVPCTVAFLCGGQPMVDQYIQRLRDINYVNQMEDDERDGGKK